MSANHKDKYQDFAELKANQRAGVDYCRTIRSRDSMTTVIAPHGGGIEPGTSEIAIAVAGNEFSLYVFEGVKRQHNYQDLHITGTNFDDPDCVQLTGKSRMVLAIHGCDDHTEVVYVGGSNQDMRDQLIDALKETGFDAREDTTAHSGRNPQNICNRGLPEGGVQLEIAEGLRKKMFRGLKRSERLFIEPPFEEFVNAVRRLLIQLESVEGIRQSASEAGGRV